MVNAGSENPFQKSAMGRESIPNLILRIITDQILTGKLKPGDKLLTEVEMSNWLRVGRNSIREAIKVLVALGLLEIRRGSGTYIAESISDSMMLPLILSLAYHQGPTDDLQELRLIIDIMAAELATDKASEEEILELENCNAKLHTLAENGASSAEELLNADLAVHHKLLDLTHNALFAQIGKTVFKLSFSSRSKTMKTEQLRSSYSGHQDFIDAIKKHDKTLVRETITRAHRRWEQ